MLPLAACIVASAGRSEFTLSVFYQTSHCFDSFLIYLVNSWEGRKKERKKERVFTLCKWRGGATVISQKLITAGVWIRVILPSCKLLLGYSALCSAAQFLLEDFNTQCCLMPRLQDVVQ